MRPSDALIICCAMLVCPDAGACKHERTTRLASAVATKPQCDVEGVWELVSISVGGRPFPAGTRPLRKIVARGHFIWIGADARRDTLPLGTALDSLRATHVTGGAGTYVATTDSFTQHIDYFFVPQAEGQTVRAKCHTEAGRWFYSYMGPDPMAAGSPPVEWAEVWRRIR